MARGLGSVAADPLRQLSLSVSGLWPVSEAGMTLGEVNSSTSGFAEIMHIIH